MTQNNHVHGFISGSKTIEERQRSVEAFQNDPQCQVLFVTLKSGGTGLNLTAADYVFITEPWWNPFAEMQAVARAHRIGRQQNVVVKRFISINTIDEKITRLQQRKKSMAENVLDIEFTSKLSDADIEALLE
jgi:non-specific serine/threonine protein kinase